jgi:glycosyltransferase involved in cell wall biosynthesis
MYSWRVHYGLLQRSDILRPSPNPGNEKQSWRAPLIKDQKVVVVMPAYNAGLTIEKTWREVVDEAVVDLVIVVDDGSHDDTVARARQLDRVLVHVHPANRGYGANQKTCYGLALEQGADIVIMVHPDYQYTPKLISPMAALVASGLYDCVLGSRILGSGARSGGMPMWRYVSNRALTAAENLLLGSKLSEFHTGYRAYSRRLLEALPLAKNSDDFVFDNQVLAEIIWLGFRIGEISCPTRYAPDASSINFRRSVRYGFGCLGTGIAFCLARARLRSSSHFPVRPGPALIPSGEKRR